MLPLILLAASAGIQIYGQRKANKAQARAEEYNRLAYEAQRRQAAMASRREADIYASESQATIGATVSFMSRAGVDMTGSALMHVANMKEQAGREYRAIQIGAQFNSSLLASRAAQARRNAEILSSSSFNNLQSLGTLLNAGAQGLSMSAKTPGKTSDPDIGDWASNTPTHSSSSWPGREV